MFNLGTTPAILLIAALPYLAAAQTAPAQQKDANPANEKEMKAYTQTIPGTKVKFDMVPIPTGKFTMGSPANEKGRKKDEGPQFEVEIDAIWVGKHEVTWDEYLQFTEGYYPAARARSKAGQHAEIPKDKFADAVSIPTPLWEQDGRPILNGMGERGGYPACAMSQFAAKQYTKWLSKKTGHFYRLPTEAEWEYACRAGSTTAFSFGDDSDKLGDFAWHFHNSDFEDPTRGHPTYGAAYRKVDLKKPNAWGLYDMHGNVAEWCIDQYVEDQYAVFKGRTVKALDTIAWPKSTYPGVFRGGHWDAERDTCRSAARMSSSKEMNRLDCNLPQSLWWLSDGWQVGFRVVRPLKEPSEEEKRKYWDPDIEEIRDVLDKKDKEIRVLFDPAKEDR